MDTDTQTVLAKAAVENAKAKLRIAQQVRAQITWGSHEGPVMPVLAVLRINGQAFVFVAVNEGKGTVARQKLLKIGDTIGDNYTVLDGLKPGDHVILSGTQFLQDGAPVAGTDSNKREAEQTARAPRRAKRRQLHERLSLNPNKGGTRPCSLISSYGVRCLRRSAR